MSASPTITDEAPAGRLGDVRDRLLAWGCTESPSASAQEPLDPVRAAARSLGRAAALDLDGHWEAGRAPGPIQVIDIFSGCGGLSIGFSAVNAILPAYKILMAVDADPVANTSYAQGLDLKPDEIDVAEIAEEPSAFADLVRSRDGYDDSAPVVVVGGPPCQGFSSHRARDATDRRNSLVGDFAEMAVAASPDAIMLENVPELLTDRHWPLLEEALDLLRDAGYVVSVSVHNAAEFGVPQERFRAVVMAFRRSALVPRGLLDRGDFRTVRDSIAHLPPISAGERTYADALHFTASHRASTVETLRAVPRDGGSRPPDVGPECLRRGAEKQGKPLYEDVYGRLAWDKPAVTITNYARNPASGRYAHPEQDRGLSIREAALLQGFPGGYQLSGSLDACFRQIGNAVPPRFSAYLAAHMLGELVADEAVDEEDSGVTAPVGPSFARLIPALKAGSRAL